jgi:acyl-CoA reductase-like NAD-dependent aldehyde dehydrogenase
MASTEQIQAAHASVRSAASALMALPLEARAAAIASAARMLLQEDSELGAQLRTALLDATRLSRQAIEYGLRTTLTLFEPDNLLALYSSRNGERHPTAVVTVLAGNVFSAAARPLLLPLLCGVPVLAKAASADDVLPRFLERALHRIEPALGNACKVVCFAREQSGLERALLEPAEVVAVYGSDETVAELGRHIAPSTLLIGHGHGLGAIYIARDALKSECCARGLAARVAIDVAAYDQRGCLSPHVALMESGGVMTARAFAQLVSECLRAAAEELPRGQLDATSAARELQWRGVAAAIGELQHGNGWAVSYEASGLLRPSPGFRNLALYDCDDIADARARLGQLGAHLKALGVGGCAARKQLTSLAPYVCPVGTMQAPPLDVPLDGLHPLHGYRFA